jgi:hypothetical protein
VRLHLHTRALAHCLCLAAFALGLPSCTSDDGTPRPPAQPLPAVALGARIAVVDRTSARAFFIDPAAAHLTAGAVAVGQDPASALARNGHEDLLVLSRGVRDGRGVPAAPAELAVIPAADPGRALRHPLASRFDLVAQSPDGRFAFLYFDAAKSNPDGALLFNPNEIEVLDLDAPPSAEAKSRSLRAFGGVPQGIVFSPELQLRGPGARALRLGVVLSDNYVTLLDLENDRTEITVALTLGDDKRVLRPVQVLFLPGDAGNDPALFIRSEGSADIVTLRLVAAAAPLAERANDFRPVLSLLGAGAIPKDMALVDSATGPRLFVVAGSDAAVIDPVTSRSTSFRLGSGADRILLYQGASPADPMKRARALLIAPGGATIAFLDLAQLEELHGRDLEPRSMSGSVQSFVPLLDRGMVVAQHDRGRGMVGLSVIDLDHRTVAPLVTEALRAIVPGSSDELWLQPDDAYRLGRLGLAQLQAQEIVLDRIIDRVVPLAAGADGRRMLAVEHPESGGAITFLDADKPLRSTARSLVGFLYTDLLEGGR